MYCFSRVHAIEEVVAVVFDREVGSATARSNSTIPLVPYFASSKLESGFTFLKTVTTISGIGQCCALRDHPGKNRIVEVVPSDPSEHEAFAKTAEMPESPPLTLSESRFSTYLYSSTLMSSYTFYKRAIFALESGRCYLLVSTESLLAQYAAHRPPHRFSAISFSYIEVEIGR